MEKGAKKKLIIILIIIVVILVAAGTAYFLMSGKSSTFSFSSTDFSEGVGAMDKISSGSNANAFESTKLNPFANST